MSARLPLSCRLVLAAAALSWSPSLAAAVDPQLDAGLRGLAEADGRVARIGYQLTTANLAFCRAPARTAGFALQAIDQYDERYRPAARAVFGLDDHVAVLAVAPAGPAERAGLAVGDRLIAVDGQPLPVVAAGPARGGYGTVQAALDMIQQAFNRGDASFELLRGGARRTLAIHPEPGCAVRVQLVPSPRLEAFADDRYASVSTAMARFTGSDAELAFVLGHELAHGFLRHQALLASHRPAGRFGNAPAALVLETERQADRLALYMLARAGFDIAGIPAFLRRFAGTQGMMISFVKDHPTSRERIAAAEAVIAEIGRKRTLGQPLVPAMPPAR